MRYTIMVEKTGTGFCAYVPDLPGCIGAARTREKLKAVMTKAVQMHIELMKESGEEVPPPSIADSVDVVDVVDEYAAQ